MVGGNSSVVAVGSHGATVVVFHLEGRGVMGRSRRALVAAELVRVGRLVVSRSEAVHLGRAVRVGHHVGSHDGSLERGSGCGSGVKGEHRWGLHHGVLSRELLGPTSPVGVGRGLSCESQFAG